MHREQADANRLLIARADDGGHFRLAANLRQVQASLDRIVPALEAIPDQGAPVPEDNSRFIVDAAKSATEPVSNES